MRRRGTGSIEPTKEGRYRLRIVDADGNRLPMGTVATLAEAESILHAARDDLARSRAKVRTGCTLSEYGARWLDERDAQGLTDERSRWRTHVDGTALADLTIKEIEPGDIRGWIERVSRAHATPGNGHKPTRAGLARQTVRNCLHLVSACLQAAADDRIRPDNPAVGVRVPRRKEDLARATVEPWTWLDQDEQTCLIECAPVPGGEMVRWAIWTGMRQGEQWHLRAADIHADDERPHAVIRYGSDEGPTKTRRIRYVPLLPGALDAWASWREAAAERIAATGMAFPPLRGTRHDTRAPGPPPWWERTLEASGVRGQTGAPVTWHSLRHTCASMLVSGAWGRAWSLEEIQGLLGHASRSTVERYSHLASTALDRAADETARALRSRRDPG